MAKHVTAAAVTSALDADRWWFDVDHRCVKDENGLVVVELNPSQSNTEGACIAAAPHSLSLVVRLSALLSAVRSGEAGPSWGLAAHLLIDEAHDLIADPGSLEDA